MNLAVSLVGVPIFEVEMTCDQQRFEKDTDKHQMTIIRDNGIDRHIKFRRSDESMYWFEILTWPGTLCIRGDCGTYVFSRLTDMFEFFRPDDRGDPSKLYINTGYWCEKLQAVDCNGYGKGAAQRFSSERFEQRVKERFDDHLDGSEISYDDRGNLWNEIQSEILDYVCDGDASGAYTRLHDFHNEKHPRLFEDAYEWNCDEYEFGFLWNLYAIAWAIRKYDAEKMPSTVTLEP